MTSFAATQRQQRTSVSYCQSISLLLVNTHNQRTLVMIHLQCQSKLSWYLYDTIAVILRQICFILKTDYGFWLPLCIFSEFICYDDGCHLRKFAQNVRRQPLSPITQKLATTEIVIDRMHFKGHKDSWCRETCDPSKFKELKKVRLNILTYSY